MIKGISILQPFTNSDYIPTLDLSFDSQNTPSLLSNYLTQRGVLVSRSNDTATVINQFGQIETVNANLPRPDFDPVTLEHKGLLIEEERTNLLIHSNDLTQPNWTTPITGTGTNTLTHGNTDSILSNNTSSRWQASCGTTTNDQVNVRHSQGVTIGATYTYSVYAKSLSGTPTIGMRFGSVIKYVTLSNKWERFTFTAQAASVEPSFIFIRGGTGTSTNIDVLIQAFQLEEGSFPTSYIPTSVGLATRSADVVTIEGTTFTNFYNQSEGTFLVETNGISGSGSTRVIFATHDGTTNERTVILASSSEELRGFISDGGVLQCDITSTTLDLNTNHKMAITYATNNFRFAVDGNVLIPDNSGSVATVNKLNIGSHVGNDIQLNGHINRFLYFPKVSTNVMIKAITSINS